MPRRQRPDHVPGLFHRFTRSGDLSFVSTMTSKCSIHTNTPHTNFVSRTKAVAEIHANFEAQWVF